jgi:hypothetical protein
MSELENANVEQKDTETAELKQMSQADIDRIVEERLARERKKYGDYDDLKKVSQKLEGYGYKGTAAEQLAAIEKAEQQAENAGSYSEAVEAYADVDELPPESVINALAKKWGKSPESVEKALLKQIENDEKAEADAKTEKIFNQQKEEFESLYPDIDLNKLGVNPKFLKFSKDRIGTISKLYADFLDYEGETEKELDTLRKTVEAKEANQKNADSSTGSVKGDKPTADFISYETFEKNRHDQNWIKKNFTKIVESRAKW